MQLSDFIARVGDFERREPRERIRLLAWFLHRFGNREVLTNNDFRCAFRDLHLSAPNVSVYLPRMAGGSAPDLLKIKGGYKLEGSKRRALDHLYGEDNQKIAIARLLSELPTRLTVDAERVFLAEALKCYGAGAFRSSIVMTWNLAYDHVVRWVSDDTNRVASFNGSLARRYPKKVGLTISARSDFEELTERETVEVLASAKLISKNVADVMREKLTRRNAAAHPSSVVITQLQADDVITDLVNNVIIPLRIE